MIESFRWTVGTVALAVAVVGLAVLLTVMGVSLWQHFEGGLISQHTLNIRHSIGYIDAQNAHCEQDISDYTAAKAALAHDADDQARTADTAHMLALVSDCHSAAGQLSPSEVAAPVAQFLAAHPEGTP